MTIQRGRDWGDYVQRPSGLQLVADDSKAEEFLDEHLPNASQPIELAILKSEVARALGITGPKVENNEMLRTEFDVVEATFKLANHDNLLRRYFLGHAFIRTSWFRGKCVGVLNSSFVGHRDWAPRAHPNDGKIDVVELDESMSVRQRLAAYKLMKTGSHLPHPGILYRQLTQYSTDCSNLPILFIHGRRIGFVEICSFRVVPDAVNLYW